MQNNNTLEFALRSMMFEDHTHIVVRFRDKTGLHPLGGSFRAHDLIKRFGSQEIESSRIIDNILFIVVKHTNNSMSQN